MSIGPQLQSLFVGLRKGLLWHQGFAESFSRLHPINLDDYLAPKKLLDPSESYNARIENLSKNMAMSAFIQFSPEDRNLLLAFHKSEIVCVSRLLVLAEKKEVPSSWEDSGVFDTDYWPHQVDQKKAMLIWKIFEFFDKIPDDTTREHFLSSIDQISRGGHAILVGVDSSGRMFVEERWGENLRNEPDV